MILTHFYKVDSDMYTIAINFWFEGNRKLISQSPHMNNYHLRILMENMITEEKKKYINHYRENIVLERKVFKFGYLK